MSETLLVFTTKCNLQCAHCCDSCSPKGETMSQGNIEQVLRHIPAKTEKLILSGGEPFVQQETLFRTIDFITRNKRSILPKGDVHLQTNGFWAVNEEQAYRTLRQIEEVLHGHSIGITMTGKDKFHKAQGLEIEKISPSSESPLYKAMKRMAKSPYSFLRKGEMLPTLDLVKDSGRIYIEMLDGISRVLPFGRARTLDEKHLVKNSKCTIDEEFKGNSKDYSLTVRPDGKVYPCCWCVTPSIGNAVESPLESLVDEMKADRMFRAMIRDGPRGAAKVLGVYDSADDEVYERNPCLKCEEMFRERR